MASKCLIVLLALFFIWLLVDCVNYYRDRTTYIVGLYANPQGVWRYLLMVLPFMLFTGLYLSLSAQRLAENPKDKLMPSINQMAKTTYRMAFTEDMRKGGYPLWEDAKASVIRVGAGLSSAAIVGLFLALSMRLFPGFLALFKPFITATSATPPLAILPVVMIAIGIGFAGKVGLIFIGTVYPITRGLYASLLEIEDRQTTKALTHGASTLRIMFSVYLPQAIPRLIEAVCIANGAAWLFLIAAEGIAASQGLGYRIFLVRRYLAMDVIIPYVLVITLFAYGMEWILRKILVWLYPAYVASRQKRR